MEDSIVVVWVERGSSVDRDVGEEFGTGEEGSRGQRGGVRDTGIVPVILASLPYNSQTWYLIFLLMPG